MPLNRDQFMNVISAFLKPLDALQFQSSFTPLDFHNFAYGTVPNMPYPQNLQWERLLNSSPRPAQFADQSPQRQSMPEGFSYQVDLPVQQWLQQLPKNPMIDALLALHPRASFDTNARAPWDPPQDWGAGISFGRTW